MERTVKFTQTLSSLPVNHIPDRPPGFHAYHDVILFSLIAHTKRIVALKRNYRSHIRRRDGICSKESPWFIPRSLSWMKLQDLTWSSLNARMAHRMVHGRGML